MVRAVLFSLTPAHAGSDHHEEEVFVGKHAAPKKRVRLDTDVGTDEQQVSETLQKAQIETEGVHLRR